MLHPTTTTLRASANSHHSSNGYFLSDVCLDIPSPDTAVFRARLHGPAGSKVWVRAWVSNEIDGTLAEAASQCLNAGDVVTLKVILHDSRVPENACIRIESAPLATEHVVIIKLPNPNNHALRLGSSGKMVTPMSATEVIFTGGCYCGEVRYQCVGPQRFKGLCYCRTCQMISGGAGNLFMAVDAQTFQFTKGTPRFFNKKDHPWSPTRHFCETCGVHLTARSERAPSAVLIKVGTLDEPSVFEGPQVVTWTSEMQKFHLLPPDVPSYPEIPRPAAQPKNA